MKVALVIAGGKGIRTGQEIPKQFLTVYDKPIIIYTLENLEKLSFIDDIVVVIPSGWDSFLSSYAKQFGISKIKGIVSGGETRHESIYNGLNFICENYDMNDVVAILDANRPLIPEEVFKRTTCEITDENAFSIAVEKCTDSMFITREGETLDEPFDRNILYKGQAPECATVKFLRELYENAKLNGLNNLTTTELCLYFSKKVKVVNGSAKSFKITTKEDIELFKALLKVKNTNLI